MLFLSLKGIDGETFGDAMKAMAELLSAECQRISASLDTEKIRDKLIKMDVDVSSMKFAAAYLMRTLHTYYGKQIILLIDDYDVPLDKANSRGYYDRMVDFLRDFFGFTDADVAVRNDIERLIAGEVLEKRLVLNLTYQELDKKELLWSVMYQTGYLTLNRSSKSRQRGIAGFVIPNREIKEIFAEKVREWFDEKVVPGHQIGLYDEIWNCKAEELQHRNRFRAGNMYGLFRGRSIR